MKPLYFATSNNYKFTEAARVFRKFGIRLEQIDIEIPEIQNKEFEPIIRDKVMKAYTRLSRPVLVDVSGMSLSALNGLPGGLNRQFWDVLKDKVCDIASKLGDDSAQIIVCLSICDGQHIHTISQKDPGRIATKQAAVGTFHLDRVFIPDGCGVTLAEMSESDRDKVSYRAKAVGKAVDMLKTHDLLAKLELI